MLYAYLHLSEQKINFSHMKRCVKTMKTVMPNENKE